MASSLETNKILAAILTAGIFASGAGVVSRMIYHPTTPEEPSYIIEVAATGDEGGGDDGGGEEMSIAALLPNADLAGGETGSKKCTSCHTFEEGGDNKIGPNLHGVLGRDIASVSGFAYSDALAGLEGQWGYENMDAFLANPKGYAPGTKMAYAGMKGAEDRADLILYLQSISPDAPPLPEADDTQAADASDAAAEEAEGGESETAEAPADSEDAADSAEGAEDSAEEMAGDAAEDASETAGEAAGDAADTAEDAAGEVAEDAEQAADATEDAAQEGGEAAEDAADEAADTVTAAADSAGEAAEDAGQQAADAAEEVTAAAGDAADAAAGAAAGAMSGLVAMIADGDVAEGENVAKKCKACHVFEEGGKNKLGPALWGVVGRDIASHEGFNYSGALSELEGAWTYEELDKFLAAPKDYVSGTKMVFAGVKDEQDRADLIAYLRTLAAEPAPLGDGG